MGKKQAQQLEEALNEGAGNVEKVKQVNFGRNPIVLRLLIYIFSNKYGNF